MRLSLGYPDLESEKGLLSGTRGRSQLAELKPIVSTEQLQSLKAEVETVKASDAVLNYVMRLVHSSRESGLCRLGLSPRGALALMTASRAMALVEGRRYVMPDDVQRVFRPWPGTGFRVSVNTTRLCWFSRFWTKWMLSQPEALL